MPEHMLMSAVDLFAKGDRRCRRSSSKKLRTVEERLDRTARIFLVARCNDVVPNLLLTYRYMK